MILRTLAISCVLLCSCLAAAVDFTGQDSVVRTATDAQNTGAYQSTFISKEDLSTPHFFIGLSQSSKDLATGAPRLQVAYRPMGNFLITSSVSFVDADVQAGFMMGF